VWTWRDLAEETGTSKIRWGEDSGLISKSAGCGAQRRMPRALVVKKKKKSKTWGVLVKQLIFNHTAV
jgi:hypothetical protein